MSQQQPTQLKVELNDAEAEGIYANLAMIMHSPTEIIIDFARVMPRTQKARVLSRIIMTPMHAKVMSQTLQENLKKFEEQFGEIKVHGPKERMSKSIGFEARQSDDKGNE